MRFRQAGLLLLDLLLARLHVLLPRPDVLLPRLHFRLSQRDLVLRALERLTRREAVLPQLLLPLQICLSLYEVRLRRRQAGLRLLDREARLLEPRLRGGHARLAALQASFELPRVDLEQELTRLDPLAFFDGEARDAPHLVGRDVHLALRLDLAGRGHDRLEVARPNRLGVHGDAGLAPEVHVRADRRGGDDKDGHSNQDLFTRAHRLPGFTIERPR